MKEGEAMAEQKTYTEAQMKAAIKSAFQGGVEWATVYVSWFTPTKKQNNDALRMAIKNAMEQAEQEGVGA